jgi:hypothetical protein
MVTRKEDNQRTILLAEYPLKSLSKSYSPISCSCSSFQSLLSSVDFYNTFEQSYHSSRLSESMSGGADASISPIKEKATHPQAVCFFGRPIGAMPSRKERTGTLLAKVKYHQKEREGYFQNSWDRPGVSFLFHS